MDGSIGRSPRRIGSLFSGIGGLELGLEWAGVGETTWQVEKESYATQVLARHWPDAVRYRDVRDVGAHNLAAVDVLCGGFPCQDLSLAGRRAGLAGERSGLWREYLRLVRELGPELVVVENVPPLLAVLGDVLGPLAALGYDAWWDCLGAHLVGAPHLRQRVFVVAYRGGGAQQRREPQRVPRGAVPAVACVAGADVPDAGGGAGGVALADRAGARRERAAAGSEGAGQRAVESGGTGMANARRVGRLRGQDGDSRGRADGDAPGRLEGADQSQRGGCGVARKGLVEPCLGGTIDGLSAGVDGTRPPWNLDGSRWPAGRGEAQHAFEPPRVAVRVPNRAPRLRGLGNAVVPQVGYVIGCVALALIGAGR